MPLQKKLELKMILMILSFYWTKLIKLVESKPRKNLNLSIITLMKLIKLFEIINKNPNHQEYLNFIKNYLSDNDSKLFSDLETVINMINSDKKLISIEFDLSLARGLEYYTGMIYEVSLKSDSTIGSLGELMVVMKI